MRRPKFVIISALIVSLLGSATVGAEGTVVVVVPAKAGAVDGTTENSDAFIWRVFAELTTPASTGSLSPVVFETWASNDNTFSTKPHWPEAGEPIEFHGGCEAPVGAAAGGFPTSGSPLPCIAEQVARNRPQFDYIVSNNLNTQAGLAAAYANSFKVDMPAESIAVKTDWIPLPMLLQWIPRLGDLGTIRKLYYTETVGSVEYALVAMHVSSHRNPNWVWGTFEHQMNPGRCDAIGCFDSFGAQIAAVAPNRTTANAQYGPCPKTPQLKTLMANANLSPVWENYCLKSTEVDFTAADGTPYVLGNSMTEAILGNGPIAASSCIACHVYASFGPTGKPTASATAMRRLNPTGNPIPGVLAGSLQFGFMWGIVRAPGP